MIVAPSILSADFACLAEDIKKVENAGAEWLHIDVMDGHFVPNITIGPPVVQSIRRITHMLLDVHLMIENPERYIVPFVEAGADTITVHLETLKKPRSVVQAIHHSGVKAGLSIKPKTPAYKLYPFLQDLDLVLVMTVEPGFGGQKFMSNIIPKIKLIKQKINASQKKILLEVDGGITLEHGRTVAQAGVDVIVAGNAIFSSENPSKIVKQLASL